MDADVALHINTVIRAKPGSTSAIEGLARVLLIHEDFAYLMRLDINPLHAPYKYHFHSIMKELDTGQVTIIDKVEMNLPLAMEQLSPSAQTRLANSLAMLQPLLLDKRALHDEQYRGLMIRTIAANNGKAAKTILRLYYRYLWGGQTKLALCSYINYQQPKQQQSNTAKRGPKSKPLGRHYSRSLPDIRSLLEKGAREYYLSGNHTLKESYVLTLKYHFSTGTHISVINSLVAPQAEDILPPVHEQASLHQFRYVCEQLEGRFGKRTNKPRRMRPEEIEEKRRGTVRDDVPGPGFRFEIDSTKLQVQLVSSFNRSKLAGTATLYLIIDVWSGAIVGYFISIEHSSWSLAAQSLLNTFQNKGEIFKRLKLPYTSKDWPCNHLPSCLTADRAELLSDKSKGLPHTGVKVEIMPPMRPQLKPLVERAFSEAKHGHFFKIPGRYPKFRKRREPDGKHDAILTVYELEQVIVEIIMAINNEPQCRGNIPVEMLGEEKPDVTRIGIYSWGIKHRPGYTRILPQREVRTYLLMHGKASIQPNGIYFMGYRYFSQRLMESGLISLAASRKHFQVAIRYDEHMASVIWFIDNDEWVEAYIDNDDVIQMGLTFAELKQLRLTTDTLIEKAKSINILRKDEKRNRFNQHIKRVKEESQDVTCKRTKAKAKIRENNALEQDIARMQRSTEFMTNHSPKLLQSPVSNPLSVSDNDETKQGKKSIVQMTKELWDKMK